jgi:hypothetical protein
MLVFVTDRSTAERSGGDVRYPASVAPSPPTENLRTRLAAVPRAYVAGAGVVVLLLLLALGVTRLKGSSDDAAAATTDTTAVAAAAPAPTVTTVPTTASPEQDAARRSAFVQTMTRLGLTEPQANCVADKVAEQVGWSKLGVNLMDSENAKLLESLMLLCVKPG